jgi:hypothetical protein
MRISVLPQDAMTTTETAMSSYDVRFLKTVCDDTGHAHLACQAIFQIDADCLGDAVQRAEANFCRQMHVPDWTLFADAVECRSVAALGRL